MRIARSIAAGSTAVLLLFGPVLVGVLFPNAPLALGLACLLWVVIFVVIPVLTPRRGGQGGSPSDISPSGLPWQDGDGGY